MVRWTVNLTGIDAEADLQRDDRMKTHVSPAPNRRDAGDPADAAHVEGTPAPLGTVATLTMGELIEQQRTRREASLAESTLGQFWIGPAPSKDEHGHSKGSEIRVFSTFTNPQGRRTVCTIQPRQTLSRGVDVVNAFLQQTLVPDERLSARFSTNPRVYKLYIADEFTGEEDLAFQLDSPIQKLTCFAVQPLPAAKLFLFPQRTRLLPSVAEDIDLSVEVRPLDSQAKAVKLRVLVPADMLAESLERAIVARLPGVWLVPGSLRIKYGPVELNINEYYNFGTGCGNMDVPIAERTVLSLHRFGVTEVLMQGRAPDGNADASAPVEDIVINIDAEKAQSLEQFEVIRINRHGARQQRILYVDGQKLCMKRPYTSGSGVTPECEERLVKDIEEVRSSPTRPKCLEICYSHASKHESDHIECTTAYYRALLDEKLRVVQRELRKNMSEEKQKLDGRVLPRLFGWLRHGLGKGAHQPSKREQ